MNKLGVRWAVDDAVREAMHRDVIGAVSKAVYWNAYEVADDDAYRTAIRVLDASVRGAVHMTLYNAVREDPLIPALQDFLRDTQAPGYWGSF